MVLFLHKLTFQKYLNMYRFITITSILFFYNCSSYSNIRTSCDFSVILDDFIDEQIQSNSIETVSHNDKLIILMNFNKTWVDENQYKVILVAYDKNMPYGIEEERSRFKEYGLFSYKGFEINITSENNMNVEKILNCFQKVSENGFFNPEGNYGVIGLNMNYDPPIKSYVLDKNFKYLYTYEGSSYPDYKDKNNTEKLKRLLKTK